LALGAVRQASLAASHVLVELGTGTPTVEEETSGVEETIGIEETTGVEETTGAEETTMGFVTVHPSLHEEMVRVVACTRDD